MPDKIIRFTATLLQFAQQGEKTGWTYVQVPSKLAQQLKPGNKKSFRVKGKLDDYAIKAVALLPMGGGEFIFPVNATMRKGIGKKKGAQVKVQLQVDSKPLQINKEFLECLADEPKAQTKFDSLPNGHRVYFSKWIDSAKTEPTKTKRIAQAVTALAKGWGYGEMIRSLKADRDELSM